MVRYEGDVGDKGDGVVVLQRHLAGENERRIERVLRGCGGEERE